MALIAYLSHPVGPGNGHGLVQKQDNIANASEWLRFLVESTRWAIVCPWFSYIAALGSELHRPRGLIDQLMILERCDLLVLCGGWLSPHMRLEHSRAIKHGIPILDLTDYGERPPDRGSSEYERAGYILTSRANTAIASIARRVWLPPLTVLEIQALRLARNVLREDPTYDEASELLRKIITAAGHTQA